MITHARLGVVLTALWLVVCAVVATSDERDWWGAAAIFGVALALYWSVGRELFTRI